jgi:hypothetical protein
MSKTFLLLCFVLCTLLLICCAKSESTTNRDAAAPASPKASPAATTTTTATTTTAGDKIGVPECDAFIAAYESCIHDKVPAAARATFETGVAKWKKSWHDLAANPQTKATLVGVCKAQVDSAKTSMKAYGCTF